MSLRSISYPWTRLQFDPLFMENPATLTAFLRLLISPSLKILSLKHEHETDYVTHEWIIYYAKQRVCLVNIKIKLRSTMFRDDDFYTLY